MSVFPSLSEFSTVVVIYLVKGFGVINKAKVDVFLEFSCFFYDPTDVGNLISDSCAFSIYKRNYLICVCPFVFGLFHLVCFQDSSML